APVRPEAITAVSDKSAPDLTLRSEVTAPETTHRELPNLGVVTGVGLPADALAKADDSGGVQGAEIVGQAPRMPESRFGPIGLAPSLQPQQQDSKPVQQQFEIIGVLSKLYVLMENTNGLVLVDQHAAHERVLFEELRRRMEQQGVPTQKLLLPQTFDVPPRD